MLRGENPRVRKRWRTMKRWRKTPPVRTNTHGGGTFIPDTADVRLLNLGIPPSATVVRLEKTVVPIGHDWQGCVDHRLEKTVVSSGTTTDLRKQ